MPGARNNCGSPQFRRRARAPSVGNVATYMIETYLSRSRAAELEPASSRLRAAVAAVRPSGGPLRYVRSFFVPEDEMCFHVVEAPSIEATLELSRRAGISPERIVEAQAPP